MPRRHQQSSRKTTRPRASKALVKFSNMAVRATTSATFASSFTFSYANLLSDISSSSRPVLVKKVRVSFSPVAETIIGSTEQPLSAQLFTYNVDQNANIARTPPTPLSNSNKTVLSFRPTLYQADWTVSSSTDKVFDLLVYNAFGTSAGAISVNMAIDVWCQLSPNDAPALV
jgi:hypothetical protein